MKTIEYRKYITKPIRLSCAIQFPSGSVFHGYTKDVSLNGVTVQIASMPSRAQAKIGAGDSGLLTLRFSKNNVEDSIRLQSQLSYISANGMGLSIRFYELSKKEQQTLGELISSGKAQLNGE